MVVLISWLAATTNDMSGGHADFVNVCPRTGCVYVCVELRGIHLDEVSRETKVHRDLEEVGLSVHWTDSERTR